MMKGMVRSILGVLTMVAMTLPMAADAQNYGRNPSFGTYNLNAGFSPDPYGVNITAGGTIPAERLGGSSCVGTIADAPDVRLNYRAGTWPLGFFVRSSYDTTLVVNDPSGRWYCNDDYDGFDPAVIFSNPQSGQYDIWIGNYDRGRGLPATLYFTEVP